ncbi:MAG: ArsA family ATPase, partial [Spirulinaceae cyanobacterium RM2_2_10]|nr:ArsA family ATPase [Spirulinaceae cyanobacterium RM2_2_10]
TAQYLWGSAQQIGLTVASTIWNQGEPTEAARAAFSPLPIASLPSRADDDWQPLQAALPNLRDGSQAPPPLTVDTANRQVRVFLPGFDKKQVKLTQYGPEITIEAGDQRRNLTLPPPLKGQPVKGAKFQDRHLVISL